MTIDIIREHLLKAKAAYSRDLLTEFCGKAINNDVSPTCKYYKLITENPIYASKVDFHPTQKKHYFNSKQTENDKQLQVASYENFEIHMVYKVPYKFT